MYNMKEVDIIMVIENNNFSVIECEESKKTYEIECKKMDDLLIQYHQLVNIYEKNAFYYAHIISQRNSVEMTYFFMMSCIRRNGDKIFDTSMIQ